MAEIVLVDDANILASVRIALEADGFPRAQLCRRPLGIAALENQPADIGVFDVKMPRMDGLNCFENCAKTAQCLWFLTSKDDGIDEVFGLKMGADDYITKPFSQRLLIERIRAVLRRSAARAERRRHQNPPSVRGICIRP